MRKILITGMAVLLGAVTLSSCTTNGEDQAAKTFDGICAGEQPLYAAWEVYTQTKDVDPKVVKRVEDAHIVITQLCTDRPDNIVAGLSSLSAAWIKILSATAVMKDPHNGSS